MPLGRKREKPYIASVRRVGDRFSYTIPSDLRSTHRHRSPWRDAATEPVLELGFLPLGRFVDERLVDMGDDSSTGNGGLDQGVKLLITTNGQLQMPRGDALYFEIFAGVSCQFEDFGREVFQDSGCVNCGRGSHALARLDGTLEEPMNTTHGELWRGFTKGGEGERDIVSFIRQDMYMERRASTVWD